MRIDPSTLDLKEKVVFINRVTKVVKGGRNFRFSALVVVGDENGHVGVGMGKSIEIPEAIKKGIEDAKKNMVSVAIVGTTVPHEIYGKFGTGKVLIMPAKEGTGVIAGGPARAVLELAGLKDVRAKSLGSNNPRNMVNATINGLASLRTAEEIARLRGKSVEEILGQEVYAMAKIKVTLVKSLIGRKKDHIATANALGLRKINKTVEHEDTPQIRGMINKVDYLLKVEEV